MESPSSPSDTVKKPNLSLKTTANLVVSINRFRNRAPNPNLATDVIKSIAKVDEVSP